jgi:DNA-binding CsgD family transcriptional regulator
LFLQRAAAAVPGFTAGPGDLRHVIGVARLLDGNPLALEMAAVRLRALPLSELASRLEHRLPLLTSGHRGSRHKTLRDAIGWSYTLCTPVEQALWERLSVFAGPFTLGAAEEVCAGPHGIDRDQVMPTVIRLVDKSLLVRVEPAAEVPPGEPSNLGTGSDLGTRSTLGTGSDLGTRSTLGTRSDLGTRSTLGTRSALETPGCRPTQYLMTGVFREFGAEQLARGEAERGTKDRFIARYLAMATAFHDRFLDDGQLARLSELRREHANVIAALGYALGTLNARAPDDGSAGDGFPDDRQAALGLALATALSSYWYARGLACEGTQWLGKALPIAPAGSVSRGWALLARSRLLAIRGGAAEALAHVDEALAIAAALGDEHLAARGNLVRSIALISGGQFGPAAEASDTAAGLLGAIGDQAGLAELAAQQSCVALLDEDIDASLGHVETGLRMLSQSRERCLHANLYLLASLALCLAGRDTEATWTATRALTVKQEVGDLFGITFTLELLGWLAARSGGHQRAAWLLGGADPLWERMGGRLAFVPKLERLHADAVARSERALGAPRFAELFTRAASRPADAMIAFALNHGTSNHATGNHGTSNHSTGSHGTGSHSTGDHSTGSHSTGSHGTGSHSTGDHSTGNHGVEAGEPGDGGPGTCPADVDGPGADGDDGTEPATVQLTSREQEIAALVAAGLSNRQIAEKLFISRRTVDAHLEHIFSKLGITSRVMLTIQLREHSALIESAAGG